MVEAPRAPSQPSCTKAKCARSRNSRRCAGRSSPRCTGRSSACAGADRPRPRTPAGPWRPMRAATRTTVRLAHFERLRACRARRRERRQRGHVHALPRANCQPWYGHSSRSPSTRPSDRRAPRCGQWQAILRNAGMPCAKHDLRASRRGDSPQGHRARHGITDAVLASHEPKRDASPRFVRLIKPKKRPPCGPLQCLSKLTSCRRPAPCLPRP